MQKAEGLVKEKEAAVWTVHELLEKGGYEMPELQKLSQAQLAEQFGWLDHISFNRLTDAIDYANSQPVWLTRYAQQVRLALGERLMDTRGGGHEPRLAFLCHVLLATAFVMYFWVPSTNLGVRGGGYFISFSPSS